MSKATFFLAIALFILVNISSVNAQQEVYGDVRIKGEVRTQEEIWEYKTLFDYGYESKLNDLGKASWELVGVVANEKPNPPILIFKRRFNQNRIDREAEEAKKLSEPKPTNPNKIEIIDADALELKQKNEALQRGQEQAIRQALANYKNAPLKIESLRSSSTSDGRIGVDGAITIDGSNALLKDGKYRASEAQKFLRDKAIEIAAQMGLQIYDEPFNFKSNGNTDIRLSLIVNYQGTSKVIVYRVMTGVYVDSASNK